MNKKNYLRTIAVISATLLMTISCQENNSLINSGRIKDYTFDGKEGSPISFQTADDWIQNYTDRNGAGVTSHFFGSSLIREILMTNNAVGIRIYYSLDDSDEKQLMLIGADNKGQDILPFRGIVGKTSTASLRSNMSGKFIGSEGEHLTEGVSKKWVDNYSQKNPSGMIAHFFGHEIINQILSENGCVGIRIYYALNDVGIPQLLLIGTNANGDNLLPSAGSNSKVDDDGNVVGDMSYPCPTFCSGK